MSAVIDTLITRNGVICSEPEKSQRPRFEVSVAETQSEVLESQRLRYEIFAGELGAEIDGDIDCDEYDPWCRHLLVRETATGRLVACTRMLADTDAPNAGGFYSSGEFDLAMLDALPGRVMEIGRTCVHPFPTIAANATPTVGNAAFGVDLRTGPPRAPAVTKIMSFAQIL